MSESWLSEARFPAIIKVVGAAAVGAAGGLATTALVLGSPEFSIFGAVGGAVAAMIGVLAQHENADS
jgi:hypothetical protein